MLTHQTKPRQTLLAMARGVEGSGGDGRGGHQLGGEEHVGDLDRAALREEQEGVFGDLQGLGVKSINAEHTGH